jgi:hypothetical protein
MKSSNDPAFPLNSESAQCFALTGVYQTHYGLTKREYFAAMAMQGILAGHYKYFEGNDDVSVPDMVAKYAVKYADALLDELNK